MGGDTGRPERREHEEGGVFSRPDGSAQCPTDGEAMYDLVDWKLNRPEDFAEHYREKFRESDAVFSQAG
jgi:hypothetical protein